MSNGFDPVIQALNRPAGRPWTRGRWPGQGGRQGAAGGKSNQVHLEVGRFSGALRGVPKVGEICSIIGQHGDEAPVRFKATCIKVSLDRVICEFTATPDL